MQLDQWDYFRSRIHSGRAVNQITLLCRLYRYRFAVATEKLDFKAIRNELKCKMYPRIEESLRFS